MDPEAIGASAHDAESAPLPPARTRPRMPDWRPFAELFALSGVAIAQPLLDLLSKNTGIFVAHHTTGLDAIGLVLLILFLVPLVGWFVELLVGLARASLQRWVHGVFAGVLVGVIALEVIKKQTSLGSAANIRIAVLCAVAGAALVFLFAFVRQFLQLLAVAPLVFALIFLGASPATKVVFHAGSTTAATIGVKNPVRIVFVVLDELPEMSLLDGKGQIDSQLYPNMAAFANDSTWYRNESTVAPYTDFAVPAILDGQYPKTPSALPVLADYPNNLFTLLGKSYGMNVDESGVTQLCPSSLCKTAGSSGGFTALAKDTAQLWKEYASPKRSKFSFADDAGVGIALPTMQQFIDSLHPASGPELDFVHIVFPHNPWHFLPTLQDTKVTVLRGAEDLAWGNQALADSGRQRHILQTEASDVLVGRVMAKLKKIGAYDNSMVIVTADHGVAFTAGAPMRAASEKNYPQILWPPLFIKYPNQTTGKVDDRPAQTVDILPTIADVLGVKIPFHVDGISLLGTPRAEGPRPFYQWLIPGGFGVAGGVIAVPGKDVTFDGAAGFKQVIRARAAPPGPDPALRPYSMGTFGALVGKPAAPIVRDQPGPETVAIGTISTLQNVNPTGKVVPWAYQDGGISNISGSVYLAIADAGRIVAVTEASPVVTGSTSGLFTFMIPPQLAVRGHNANPLKVYIVRGTEKAPTLDPIPLTG